MLYYYGGAFILTAICLALLAFTFEGKRVNYYILLMMLLIVLANGGYLSIALSQNVREAVMANRISYLGGCFIPPMTLLLICAVCNYKIAVWKKALMYLSGIALYLMVLTIGSSSFYYSEIALSVYEGATILKHSYGPGHKFFYIFLYGYVLIFAVLLVYTSVKKRAVSKKNLHALIGWLIVNVGLFTLGRFLNPAVEIMPLVYVADSLILLYMYRRGLAYNLEDNIMLSLGKRETAAYIMFDNSLNYLGCNSKAAELFPGLLSCIIDEPLRKELHETACIMQWLLRYQEEEHDEFEYEWNDRHYEGQIEKLWYRKKKNGYMLELRENTDKWKYTRLLAEHNRQLELFQQTLEEKVNEQTGELRMQRQKIEKQFVQTITALSEAVDAKDHYTSGHSKRVAGYARMIAERMGKSREQQEEIYRAGLLHDIGKIRIPVEIINKPGNLTEEEYNIIKIHPVTGYQILHRISEDSEIAIAARYHHERYDGKGYPNGLSGRNIPENARILGVADSYDAMASNRSYRKALPQEVVRAEIEKGKGKQFDPEIADIMLQLIDEDNQYLMKQNDVMQKRILTIDDDPADNEMFTRIMQTETSYQIFTAGSAAEALELLESRDFDLILLGVRIPLTNEIETLKQLREKCQTAVVLTTRDSSQDILSEFSEYGCDDFITKPYSPLLLKEVVYIITERISIER